MYICKYILPYIYIYIYIYRLIDILLNISFLSSVANMPSPFLLLLYEPPAHSWPCKSIDLTTSICTFMR